jgi:VanZ family protein
MHLLVFAGMFVVIFRALDHELRRLRPRSNIVLAGLVTCAVGALLEVHQLGIPGRSAELLDFVADSLGAWLAAFAVYRWMLRSSRRASSEG